MIDKKIIGKDKIWEYDKIINLNKFKDLLMKEYDENEPILDLAKFQSTFPSGERSTFTKSGNKFYSMVTDYTYDGVHLNKMARKKAAEQMLLYLLMLI